MAREDVTEAARKLRRADEQQLRLALAALKHGGRFIIIVANEATWPEVRERLARELSPSPLHDVRLVMGDDVMCLFSSPVVASDGNVVLHIGDDATAAVATLNLHRDKLRHQACRFIVRLDGAEVHQRFVREAPDCYSFRDAVAVVEGRAAAPSLRRDRQRVKEIERIISTVTSPEQLRDYAVELFVLDRPDEAHRALDRGIALLEVRKKLSFEQRSTMAALHYYRANRAAPEEQFHHLREALRILEPASEQFEEQYANILGQLRDGQGTDVDAARKALAIARQSTARVGSEHESRQCVSLAEALWRRDDVKGAREVLRQVSLPWWMSSKNELFMEKLDAGILIDEGRWQEAEQRLRDSLSVSARGGHENWFALFALDLARLLVTRGELEAAMDAIALVPSADAESLRVHIRCAQADPEAIATLARPLVDQWPAAEKLSDALDLADRKAGAIRRAVSAGLLEPSRCERLDAELESLAAHVAAVGPVSPPWSRINADLLVADHLLARSGAEDRARAAATRALDLAQAGAPELIPRCVRRIVVASLRAGVMDGLDVLLDEALAAADARHLPGESARLTGLRLWRATRLGHDVAEAERALDASIERTGSTLVAAEVLLQVGRGAGRREVLERSRRIYRALPWPAQEAKCLEALGMTEAARMRYEAFGLRLDALALERRAEPAPIGA